MNFNNTDFQMILINIVYIFIVMIVPILINFMTKCINNKVDQIQATTKLSKYTQMNQYIDTAQSVITMAVQSVSQTYVDSLKKNGQWNEATANIAKDKAITLAKSLITTDSENAIETIFGDFEKYIDTKVEEIVKKLK